MLGLKMFRQWRAWFRQQPWSFKWFLWLVLLRPLVDIFWFVKETSLISPLQITGMLTFFFAFVYGLKLPSQGKNQLPVAFNIFAILLMGNLLLISFESSSSGGFIRLIRFITPIFLFVYVVKVMRTESRFHGLLFTWLISSILPLSMLFYEIIFDPISQVALAESRGGGFRLTGLYADLFSYLSYVVGDLLILSYFFIRSLTQGEKQVGVIKIAAVLFLCAVGISGLKHQATWIVFIFIIGSVVLSGFGSQRVKTYVLLIGFPVLLIAPVVILPTLETLFAKEVKAYRGEGKSEKVLNGRLIRWERHFEVWEDVSTTSKLVGISVADVPKAQKNIMSGGGMHSDYVRFLFTTGIIGLVAFLMFYLRIFMGRVNYRQSEKFFISTSLGIMCLYSVTSNPFGSSGSLMFLLFCGLAISLNSAAKFYYRPDISAGGKESEKP